MACRFYHEDTHRRQTTRQCRLIARNLRSDPWKESLCQRCPVPQILEQNPCAHLALEAKAEKRWRLFPWVKVYAVCTTRLVEVKNPIVCRRGCKEYRSAF